jgi:hypothetical protein
MEVGNSPPHGERGDSSNRGGTTTGEPGKFARSGKAKKKTNNAAMDPVISGNPSAGHCNSGFTSSTGEGSSGGGGGSGGSGLAENTRPERVYKNLRQPSGDRDPDMRDWQVRWDNDSAENQRRTRVCEYRPWCGVF